MKGYRPFKKILIANRGEIALRIIRACKELGIKTVAVYSEADRESLHAKLADESVCVGPALATLSYLNKAALLSAADITGADAIHPGYGFLSENAEFARLCGECKVTFIGPTPEAIEQMGEKTNARAIAKEADVPLLPGTTNAVTGADEAAKVASEIGYPVVLKAVAGGGGRGIYRVFSDEELRSSYDRCSAEVLAAFSNGAMYVEKYVQKPRHVEIQVACDVHGNRISLGERDCSIQRRHQKVLEEAPSTAVDEKTRERMGIAALRLCEAVNYTNVGTVEFLMDQSGDFFFMEMNTRIQVEHPVTEMVTGVDLLKEQIRIAQGEKLSVSQEEIKIKGHSIECRINAEDSVHFRPSPGKITALHVPGGFGVRVESFIYDQYTVVPYYDSLIGKLIVHAPTRSQAIGKMKQALDEYMIDGIQTNIKFHRQIISDPRFESGKVDTHFLDEFQVQ